MWLAVVQALFLPTILGFLIVSLILGKVSKSGAGERGLLGFPVGMGIVTLQMFLQGIFRIPWTFPTVVGPVLVEIIALGALAWKTGVLVFHADNSEDPTLWKDHWASPGRRFLTTVLKIWLFVKIAGGVLESSLFPIFGWDSVEIWTATAKAFFHSKGMMLDAPEADFFGRGVISRALAYPLLNPLSQIWMAVLRGDFDETAVKLWSPVFLGVTVGILGRFGINRVDPLKRAWACFLFLSSQLLMIHSIEVYSDLPLGCYFLLSMYCSFQFIEGRKEFFPLAGLFMGISLFTKVEAVLFAVPMFGSLVFHIWRNAVGGSFRTDLAKLSLPLAFCLPWFAFKLWYGIPFGQETIHREFTPLFQAPWIIIRALTSMGNFNLFFPFFFACLAGGWIERKYLPLLIPLLVQMVSLFILVSVVKTYTIHLPTGDFIFRNLLTFFPMVCAFAMLSFSEPEAGGG